MTDDDLLVPWEVFEEACEQTAQRNQELYAMFSALTDTIRQYNPFVPYADAEDEARRRYQTALKNEARRRYQTDLHQETP